MRGSKRSVPVTGNIATGQGRRLWCSLAMSLLVCLGGVFTTQTTHALLPVAIDGQPLPSLAPMLENVMPAVVNISTTTKINPGDHPLLRDPFFRQFLPFREERANSLGSGVIVDAAAGLVLTNQHVIDRAHTITVTLNDGRILDAELIGSDAPSDVAVLRIPPDNLSALKVGLSENLRVGDFVVAIGSPFGLNQTVTSGIVSALGRSGLGIEGYEDFIQTDASINPGNSGGALVNLRGELIGINTAILSRGGGSVGIGLSIPMDMAGKLMAQLVEHGDIQRGLLGVAMQDMTPQLAEAFNLHGVKGAVVSEVVPGSAAAEVGMRSGDVIVQFDNAPIESSADLRNGVGVTRSGETVEIQYLREGKLLVSTVTIKSQLPEVALTPGTSGSSLEGAVLENVESDNGDERGVRVASIGPDTPASRTGLEPGDIIYNVNRVRVNTVDELMNVAGRQDGVMLVRLFRDGRPLFLVIQ